MVGHLNSPHYLSFFEEYDNSLIHPHNQLLHIEVIIHQKFIRHVLIDYGVGLNIYFANFLTQLGYDEESIDPRRKITIKAYDEVEQKSKGLVVLPIKVGPKE